MPEKEKVKLRIINRYSHYLRFPAKWIKQLPEILNKEFELELIKTNPKNPFLWEIRMRPLSAVLTEKKNKSRGQADGHKKPGQVKAHSRNEHS